MWQSYYSKIDFKLKHLNKRFFNEINCYKSLIYNKVIRKKTFKTI